VFLNICKFHCMLDEKVLKQLLELVSRYESNKIPDKSVVVVFTVEIGPLLAHLDTEHKPERFTQNRQVLTKKTFFVGSGTTY